MEHARNLYPLDSKGVNALRRSCRGGSLLSFNKDIRSEDARTTTCGLRDKGNEDDIGCQAEPSQTKQGSAVNQVFKASQVARE